MDQYTKDGTQNNEKLIGILNLIDKLLIICANQEKRISELESAIKNYNAVKPSIVS